MKNPWGVFLALLTFAGCARQVPYYAGITHAQVKWADAYGRCQGQATPECEAVRRQFTIEDAYERQERTAQAQREANTARRPVGEAVSNLGRRPVHIAPVGPIFTPAVSTRCTSRSYGGTVTTNCN
jgi:hypothetical protein